MRRSAVTPLVCVQEVYETVVVIHVQASTPVHFVCVGCKCFPASGLPCCRSVWMCRRPHCERPTVVGVGEGG
jgi:hypothetical protein